MILPDPDTTPFLPRGELEPFLTAYGNRRDQYLAAAARGTPVYVLEPGVLARRAIAFKEAFQEVLPDIGCYYAMKSNNAPQVSKEMIRLGFGLDVSSGLELGEALDLGCRDIVFSGPGKTAGELALAVDHARETTVLMDSFGELDRLETAAAANGVAIRAGVRLTDNPQGLWRKFGIPLESLPEFWNRIKSCSHVQFRGLQFHASWNMNPDRQVAFIRSLGKALAAMPGDFINALGFIDMGGGYWPPQGEWLVYDGTPEGILDKARRKPGRSPLDHYRFPGVPIQVFAKALGGAVKEFIFPLTRCRICFEPGRWICNDAMHILITVVDQKAPDLVICDGGTNAVGWERYETDYCPVLNLSRWALEEKPCHVLGSLCTPHDVWGYTYWGSDIQPGDILMIPCQGAYTYSLRQTFIKPLPPLVVL
ncbi:MAG: decarboxylase [Pseudomonadota bacterium]